jgi:hypothetical protein
MYQRITIINIPSLVGPDIDNDSIRSSNGILGGNSGPLGLLMLSSGILGGSAG